MKNMIKLFALALSLSAITPAFAYDRHANVASQKQTVDASFLHSTEGTYGWNPQQGDIGYDFFPDGRLHIEGSDGEASMWEGKWSLNGDQLTLTNTTLNTSKTVTATRDGDDLLLDGARYQRYRP